MSYTGHNLQIILDNFDLYTILGLNEGENDISIIKKAYYKKSLEYHPDKTNDNGNNFYIINLAYKILSTPENKKKYDLEYFSKKNPNKNKLLEKDLTNLQYNDEYPIIVSNDILHKLKKNFTDFSSKYINENKKTKKEIIEKFMDKNNLKGEAKDWENKLMGNQQHEQNQEMKIKKKQDELKKLQELEHIYENENVDTRLAKYKNDNSIDGLLSQQKKLMNSFNINDFNAVFEKVKEKAPNNSFLIDNSSKSTALVAYNNCGGSLSTFCGIKNNEWDEPDIDTNILPDINHIDIINNINTNEIIGKNLYRTDNKAPIKNMNTEISKYNSMRNDGIQINKGNDLDIMNKIKYGSSNFDTFYNN